MKTGSPSPRASFAAMVDSQPESAPVKLSKLTLSFVDLTEVDQATELEVSWDELDEVAELRRIVDETTGAQPVLYSTA